MTDEVERRGELRPVQNAQGVGEAVGAADTPLQPCVTSAVELTRRRAHKRARIREQPVIADELIEVMLPILAA